MPHHKNMDVMEYYQIERKTLSKDYRANTDCDQGNSNLHYYQLRLHEYNNLYRYTEHDNQF